MCHLVCEIISRPLIGHKYECYIIIEVIVVDELDKGNILLSSSTSVTISAVAGIQEKQAGAELCQAQVKLKVVVEVEFGVDVEACHY